MTTRMIQLVLLAALLLCPGLVRAQQASTEVLTLEQAIEVALSDNRQVKNAALEVSKAGDRLAAAKTYRLPEFKFNALGSQLLSKTEFRFDRGVFGDYPGIGPIPSTETVISTPRRPTLVMVGQINQPISQDRKSVV